MSKPRFSFHCTPYVAAPNVRINGGRIVHSGQ